MWKILLEVLAEIFGLGEEPKRQQPQRRTRTPPARGSSGSAPGDAAPRQTTVLEDMVRKMTGLDEAPPPRRNARTRVAARPPVPKPAMIQPAPRRPEPLPVPSRPVVPQAPRLSAGRPSGAGLEYAARLRNNPEAARDAFVFSEIFGRPLGDR